MPVEPVFNTSPAKEPSAPRRRPADAGPAGAKEGFSLPNTGTESAVSAREPAPSAAGKEKAAPGSRQQVATETTKATGKAAGSARPTAETGMQPQAQPSQSDSLIATLAGLLSAAQREAVSLEDGSVGEAIAKETAGEKGDGSKKGGAVSEEKGSGGTEAASVDKTSGEAAAIAVPPDQKTVPQPVAAMLSFSLPGTATADGVKPEGDAPLEIGGGSARSAKAPAEAVFGGKSGRAGHPEISAGTPAPTSPPTSGEHLSPTGQGHKATDAAAAAGSKTDPAQNAISAQAAPVVAEVKPAEAVQQALAPIDLATLVQQAVGGAEPAKLLPTLDQAAATSQAPAAGQGQTPLPPTPLHVLPIEIGLRALSGSKQFDIRLDPDELGRVDVNLSISDKGEVSARLVVDRVETLHLLQRDARTLERAFEQAGLKPSDSGVDISLRDPSDQSAFRQHRQQEEAPQRSRPPSATETGDDAVLPTTSVPQRRLVRLGGVDLSI
ncbi:MAG: flagellar hook-length control protein FliK [Bosea sp. (in: a-proteobacteria)]|nr:flagellar hook-length control protein FliK [Bosea sp. (in: a-proteobacteria)]